VEITAPASASPATYEVLAIRYGCRAARKSEVFLHYPVYGEADAEIGMDYFFWLARGAGRVVLIDCGFSAAGGARRSRTMLAEPVDALARLGVRPADVTQLIVTHGHYDHIGNLAAFPAAEIIMARREYDFWTGPMGSRALFAHSAEAAEIDELRSAERAGRIGYVTGSATLAGGIEVLEVGGHTPGQLIVQVPVAAGRALVASDALHYYEEADLDRPFTHVADLAAMYRGFEVLRELAGQPGTALVAGHDPEVVRRFPAAAELGRALALRIG
jgi:glyoxylase-like metal-dependent hydrolase (beta-lactamase superfamily II)